MKTFKYRIYPGPEQEKLLSDTLFLCCRVYNACLEQRKQAWESEQRSISAFDQVKDVQKWIGSEPWKERFPEAPSLSTVYAQVRNEAVTRLDKAFEAFFRRVKRGEKPGYPRFQPALRYESFTYTQGGFEVRLRDGSRLKNGSYCSGQTEIVGRCQQLHLSKIGGIRMRMHRPMEGKLKTCSIKRGTDGRWWAMLVCDAGSNPLPATGRQVGIDVGLEHFVTTSEGEFFANPRHGKKAQDQLRRAQRRLSRRVKGSRRRRKATRLVARCHEIVASQRRNNAHQVARTLVGSYDFIAAEDLNIQGMIKNRHLSRSIADAGWGQFLEVLAMKSKQTGREFVRVPPRNTSQQCSECGELVTKRLSDREHQCPKCGLCLQRDVNAARNILSRGLRELEALTGQA